MLFWRKLLKDELKKKFCLFNNKHKKIVIKIIKKTIKKNNRLIIQDVSKLKIILLFLWSITLVVVLLLFSCDFLIFLSLLGLCKILIIQWII